ncbi:tRNA threonylcarbamoyladenosine dehydratase [Campylobacter blaseri]|uniref:tRNA cyclic N6-threonylcarbamoyladenosine(37) synthase TcdA n=1 Tax=Campylobacter blaseri TaxID=2042961 RepID=A0A2P8R162_9BACT|nr:tRNA threonylcarbamoyladenosine dehydratase [Campylobacter blaseri]PSM52221.1 tRNA cyclic N6-threonylcarbamoyladenosine(37) synthase TcdA [Campylobacter blaseri]PSM53987.1 tRNA cyclic N6-threonylcarbamoyladenosine(37) synthase TcdA [Campylobacter blaseri]QKF85424.1 tRNA threonylcarbamoyladenosine dehydratase [Campylobacter blaseri]
MAEMIDRFTRSRWLFEDNFEKLQNAKVLVCGCGGVGGACIEALYRSGVINLTIIDCDTFEITNQNRQLGSENIGEKKVDVFKAKFENITPIFAKIDSDFVDKFDFSEFDFIVDAIDDINAKVMLANKIITNNDNKTKFVSSMGGAKRLNPELIKITNIWKTNTDPFARKFRYELKKSGFKGNFDVIFSTELPKDMKNLGSFMGVTATFGLFLASYVVKKLIENRI